MGQDRADGRVRAGVREHAQPVRLDASVARAADLDVEDRRARVGHRDHVLAAGLRPADRAARPARQPGDEDVLHGQRLRAEPAADVRADDAYVLRLEAEQARQLVAVLVRRLGREPGGEAPVLSDARERGARLERTGRHALADDASRDHHVAAVEQPVDALLFAEADVRLVLERALGVDEGVQRLVVDEDELGGVGGAGSGLADDDGDDLAHVADDVGGQQRPRPAVVEPRPAHRRHRADVEIRRREDLRGGRGGVDPCDARMRERRAHERDVERVLRREVLDVGPLAAQEAGILLAQDALADDVRHRR